MEKKSIIRAAAEARLKDGEERNNQECDYYSYGELSSCRSYT